MFDNNNFNSIFFKDTLFKILITKLSNIFMKWALILQTVEQLVIAPSMNS